MPFTFNGCSFVRAAQPAGDLTTSDVAWPTTGILPDKCQSLCFLLRFTGPAASGTIKYRLQETDDATGSTGWADVTGPQAVTLAYDLTADQCHLLTIKNPRKRLRIMCTRLTGANDIAVATAKGTAFGAHGGKQPIAQSVTEGRGGELIHK